MKMNVGIGTAQYSKPLGMGNLAHPNMAFLRRTGIPINCSKGKYLKVCSFATPAITEGVSTQNIFGLALQKITRKTWSQKVDQSWGRNTL